MKFRRHRSTTRTRSLGLTFGEMLVVLAVFSMLAIMFVVSSQFAIVKSKVSRVISDQRQLGKALDQYVADTMHLPSEDEGLQLLLEGPRGTGYMSQLPDDPFAAGDETGQRNFRYFTHLAEQYQVVVVSVGPDGDLDLEAPLNEKRDTGPTLAGNNNSQRMVFDSPEQARRFIAEHSYDPTNGSMSNGDIIQRFTYSGL